MHLHITSIICVNVLLLDETLFILLNAPAISKHFYEHMKITLKIAMLKMNSVKNAMTSLY